MKDYLMQGGENSVTEKTKKWNRPGMLYFLAGFLLTALVTGASFARIGVWPFGDKTVLLVDSLHQYLPFYTDLHEKLTEGESLLYSFSGGLGYNFWSTLAYYMASPLNLLMVLIPMKNVCDFMDFAILLKTAFSAGCFSWYLHRRDPERIYLPAVFGMMFGLSNFMIGYSFNLMWLESIAMLPLIMAGIEKITEGKSGRLFGFSLFYGLWCNYYIGFMLCLFSCLYFLVRWISRQGISFRAVARSCLTFAWYALLAGGMAALILLPAFMGLSTSESMQENTFPTTVDFYTSLLEMLKNHLILLEPVTVSSSQVGLNIYCGIAVLLLVPLYLFDGKIRIRERLSHYGLCAFLLLSFSFNILNYIWHGFHVQNGIPNRFAFIYIVLLLVMAYDALPHLRSYCLPELLFAAALPIGLTVYWMMHSEGEVHEYTYLVSIGLTVLYFGLLLVGKYLPVRSTRSFYAVLAGVLLLESSANAIYDCHRQYEIAGQKRRSDSRCAGAVRKYREVLSAQASGCGMHPFLPAVRETGHAGRGTQGKEVLL